MSFIKSFDGFNDIYKPVKFEIDVDAKLMKPDKYIKKNESEDAFWGYPWRIYPTHTGRWHRHIIKNGVNSSETVKEIERILISIKFNTERSIISE
jgi:hypothetical protein